MPRLLVTSVVRLTMLSVGRVLLRTTILGQSMRCCFVGLQHGTPVLAARLIEQSSGLNADQARTRAKNCILLVSERYDTVRSMIEKVTLNDPSKTASSSTRRPHQDSELSELTKESLAGNKKAQQALCERMLPIFQHAAGKLTRRFRTGGGATSREEELDILQHIVCAFLEDMRDTNGVLASWQPARGSLEAWLIPFSSCRGLAFLRRHRNSIQPSLEAIQSELEDALQYQQLVLLDSVDRVEHRESLDKLRQYILAEPALGQETLNLLERVFWAEEDRELIAHDLGIPRNTLDTRIKRLRDRLNQEVHRMESLPTAQIALKDEI